jgi:chromosome partitioning protein
VIITVGGIKGGSGKTTVATNLVVMRSLTHDVLLVDADDQESASDFSLERNQRTEGKSGYTYIKQSEQGVRSEVVNLRSKFEDIIIDTGGRDTVSQRYALSVSDILLIPFMPRSLDIWTLRKVRTLVREARGINDTLRALCFLNRSDPAGSDNQDASQILQEEADIEYIDAPLGSRKAFSKAVTQGMSVVELKPLDHKAVNEINKLYAHIFDSIL